MKSDSNCKAHPTYLPESNGFGRKQGQVVLGILLIASGVCGELAGAEAGAQNAAVPGTSASSVPPAIGELYIREYRVNGSRVLGAEAVQEAVYPYLGPGRTLEDVERARVALEEAYRAKGFQTVSVEVPQQTGRGGVIVLQVTENKVGRLRVRGSRFFDLERIKRAAPSLAEGKVPNFNEVTKDLVALNQWADRRITPELKAGVEPGTVDIDLKVQDTLPLHGSVELNNRFSADTSELRLSGSLSYNNLWQRGHSIGGSFQLSPEKWSEVKVFSAYYLARMEAVPWLSLTLHGTKQDSNVSTIGGINVVSPGETVGVSAAFVLPVPQGVTGFFHTFTFGVDYKHFKEEVILGVESTRTPVTYYPLSGGYNATWVGKGRLTELDANLNFHFRGVGRSDAEFEQKRFGADSSYLYFRGELAHTQDLPGNAQVYGKVQGQIASQPLLNSEQFAGGGLGTARGYLEAEALGDNAFFGTLELRSPSLLGWVGKEGNEWRVYAFGDAGFLTLNEALPEQERRFELASVGVGSRIRLFDHLNGSLDAALPLIDRGQTESGDVRLTFRVWADF